jgi:hypothetical protein
MQIKFRYNSRVINLITSSERNGKRASILNSPISGKLFLIFFNRISNQGFHRPIHLEYISDESVSLESYLASSTITNWKDTTSTISIPELVAVSAHSSCFDNPEHKTLVLDIEEFGRTRPILGLFLLHTNEFDLISAFEPLVRLLAFLVIFEALLIKPLLYTLYDFSIILYVMGRWRASTYSWWALLGLFLFLAWTSYRELQCMWKMYSPILMTSKELPSLAVVGASSSKNPRQNLPDAAKLRRYKVLNPGTRH